MRKTELLDFLYKVDGTYADRLRLGGFDANADIINFTLLTIRELTKHVIEKENQVARIEKQLRQGKKGAGKTQKTGGGKPKRKTS